MLSSSELPNILDTIRQQERERFAKELLDIAAERLDPPYNYSRLFYDSLCDVIDRATARRVR